MKKQIIFSVFSFIISLIIWIFSYPKLPSTLPAHWDINGSINHYASKMQVMLVLLGLMLAANILFVIIPFIDPKLRNNKNSLKNQNGIQFVTHAFFIIINIMTVYTGFHHHAPSPKMIFFITGALFIFLGNYTFSLKQNFFIGIRTPWTLSDEEVWHKTNRLGAKLLVVFGICIGLGGFLPGILPSIILIICLALMVVFPLVYSYWTYKKING
ncbi:putative membrane protein [Scopulibacillus daqui]|uniref:Membrane protein n=1 Tax=Scopulibacillus daqui TaxID=1469162 RepID=A0ABS2PXJ4_9BACL|nr:SdpI family protein [Scopulibacillus daqui]MBM7644763.1 putative membrane protein [Scopulibacillus daqui]